MWLVDGKLAIIVSETCSRPDVELRLALIVWV